MTWGTHWYEADGQWEVLLEDASDIEILVESLVDEEVQVEKVSLEGSSEENRLFFKTSSRGYVF